MKIVGMLVFRNCIENGYPFVETVLSGIPMVDEYWLNDGGSTDGTKEYMERLAETFPDKIRAFNIPDYKSRRWNCACDVINKFIEEAETEWIFIGNADELIHEDEILLYRGFLKTTTANVLRHPRREVTHNWSRLSEKPYWAARTARKMPGLFMSWETHGGDEFLIKEKGGWKWIRNPPQCQKIPVMIWHLYIAFPGNVMAKRRNDAEWLAIGNAHRKKIYEDAKGRKFNPRRPPEIPLSTLPALAHGLIGMYEYEVRKELFDLDWLRETTGINYG